MTVTELRGTAVALELRAEESFRALRVLVTYLTLFNGGVGNTLARTVLAVASATQRRLAVCQFIARSILTFLPAVLRTNVSVVILSFIQSFHTHSWQVLYWQLPDLQLTLVEQ